MEPRPPVGGRGYLTVDIWPGLRGKVQEDLGVEFGKWERGLSEKEASNACHISCRAFNPATTSAGACEQAYKPYCLKLLLTLSSLKPLGQVIQNLDSPHKQDMEHQENDMLKATQ